MQYFTSEMLNEVKSIDENTRFNDAISQKREVNLIYDYTRFYEIKPVVSYTDPNVMKISIHKDCFDMNIDISNMETIDYQAFAMALFEYAPCDNWSGFYEAGYFLEFDAISNGDIKAFQLEIKDNIRNKIIDKTVTVSSECEHFQIWMPSTTRDLTSWRKISQMCFTVFFNDNYIKGKQGVLTIKNLKMLPR